MNESQPSDSYYNLGIHEKPLLEGKFSKENSAKETKYHYNYRFQPKTNQTVTTCENWDYYISQHINRPDAK